MGRHEVRLSDRYDLEAGDVLLSGTQALVRLVLMQAARDRAAGWRTAGYVTGYRGSPLGGVDVAMQAASAALEDAGVVFQPGLNEDLAATAVSGTQQVALRDEGRVEGVFGLWYGKGPGVDRSGDALRHANLAGTAPRGGVVMVAGDDHTGESSTTCHQSDLAMIDAGIPVLYPSSVQEYLDYGLYGFAMSRFSGLWVGMKAVKDTADASAVVEGRTDRMSYRLPDIALPEDGVSIRLGDHWAAQEVRLVQAKWPAARAFARANGIDRRRHGGAQARIGLVAAGKSWTDLHAALELLGVTPLNADMFGLTTWKLGQIWPIDDESLREWAVGLDHVIVVEEKRKLIEPQVAQALWGQVRGLWGARGPTGPLFPEHGALDPTLIARRLGDLLVSLDHAPDALRARHAALAEEGPAAADLAVRLPYFCAGCPHNTSTRVPEGSRAGGGIGCHTMALWMDRANEGYTQMGAEGATWIGEAPFSRRSHVFQNLGDGTYNHSGMLAMRAAIASGVNITYKILFNDAVAMTGGQANDGGLTPERIAAEVLAMGASKVVVVHDGAEGVADRAFPADVDLHHRDGLDEVQRGLQQVSGVSVLIYVQTCAAEKRRRRRKQTFPAISTRVFIDPDVCEGCGDCGVQSNCVAIQPLETPLGRKRVIDQSACNADLSCLKGFCPSFITVEGGTPRRTAPADLQIPVLPEPELPALSGTWNIVVTGIGGTGAVTIGSVLAMAAHVEGLGAGVIEMAGLAQKGGAVQIHLRIAERPSDISAIRVPPGEADAIIGGDLVTTATMGLRATMAAGRTRAIVNAQEALTGEFTRKRDFTLPMKDLEDALRERVGDGLTLVEATRLAATLLGDAIFANMLLAGAAWQKGLVPLEKSSILRAIELNGTAAEANRRAFEFGRWAVAEPTAVARLLPGEDDGQTDDLDTVIARREAHLVAFQSPRLARRYRQLVDRAPDDDLRRAIALGYHKLLAYKDEYEVARLLATSAQKVATSFEGDLRLSWHLAPPILSWPGPDGSPRKRRFGAWIVPAFKLLSALKILRGTPVDPFGQTAERQTERALIRDYESDLDAALSGLTPRSRATLLDLAELPMEVRGFGPVKLASIERYRARRDALLAELKEGGRTVRAAAK